MNRTKHCSSSSPDMSSKCKIPADSQSQNMLNGRGHTKIIIQVLVWHRTLLKSHTLCPGTLFELCHRHYKPTLSLSPGSDTPRKLNNFSSCSSEQHQGNAEGGFKASRDLTKQKYAKKSDRTISTPLLQDVCFGNLNNFTCDSA